LRPDSRVEQVLHQVDRRDHSGGQPQLPHSLLDGPLGVKNGNSGVPIRTRAGDEDQVGRVGRRQRVRQVSAVALLAAWPCPVGGAAGDDGVHAGRGGRQAAGVPEVGADDLSPGCREPGRLGMGRVPGGRAYRVPAGKQQVGDTTEPPGRPADQDPPGGGTRYPVIIVR
jgi:hypothetical protein